MKIFPTTSIKQLDAYTIENEPIDSIDLMERAANALAKPLRNVGTTSTLLSLCSLDRVTTEVMH